MKTTIDERLAKAEARIAKARAMANSLRQRQRDHASAAEMKRKMAIGDLAFKAGIAGWRDENLAQALTWLARQPKSAWGSE